MDTAAHFIDMCCSSLLYFTVDLDKKYRAQRELVLCQRSNLDVSKYSEPL